MLTDLFYTALADRFRVTGESGRFFVAVGTGDPAWDDSPPPPPERDVTSLVRETARLLVADVVFLDDAGRPTERPTQRLGFSVNFGRGEANGTLRECGLFGGIEATGDLGTGSLLSYFTFRRIDKTEAMTLERTINVDLTPQPCTPGTRPTRFLGNTATTELHDLENLNTNCQVDEIRIDRQFFFNSVEEATDMGYDFCANCFSRQLSQR